MIDSFHHLFPGIVHIKPIGYGSFSSVYTGEYSPTHTQVAIKVISRESLDAPSKVIHFQREIELMRKIDHPFIAQYISFVSDMENYFLLMEFGSDGNLLNMINSNGKMNERDAQKVFCQLTSALRYLHEEMLIAHRDLKMENLLLNPDFNLRLIDFGLSAQASLSENLFSTFCGSLPYIAPEIVNKNQYTYAVDMWSAGVLLYTMVVGHLPFSSSNTHRLMHLITNTEPEYPETLSSDLTDLIKRLLTKNNEKRITAAEASIHPWVMNSDFSGYPADCFLMDRRFKVIPRNEADLDRNVLEQMEKIGIRICDLLKCNFQKDNESNSIYRMLRKARITSFLPSKTLHRPYQLKVISDREEKEPSLPMLKSAKASLASVKDFKGLSIPLSEMNKKRSRLQLRKSGILPKLPPLC